MAEKQDSGLIGYDPLAWIDEEDEGEANATEQVEEPVNSDKEHEKEASDLSLDTEPDVSVSHDAATVALEPVLNIQQVENLHRKLLGLLDNHDKIEVDASAVTSVDTAVLQLLIILKKTAVSSGKDVAIDFPSEQFIEAADLLGLSEMLEVEQAAAGFF